MIMIYGKTNHVNIRIRSGFGVEEYCKSLIRKQIAL